MRTCHTAARSGIGGVTGCGETRGLGVVIVIWTLTPIYNMVAVALESHGDARPLRVRSQPILP